MQSKVSSEKNSISINLGSIMERDEKRFEYRFCCSSEENNMEEDKEGGIGVVDALVAPER